MIWVGVAGFAGQPRLPPGRRDAFGRRPAGFLVGMFGALVHGASPGFYYDGMIAGVSAFWVFIMVQRFFGDGAYAIIGPYTRPRSGRPASAPAAWGFGYGLGNLGIVIGPFTSRALICGQTELLSA